MALKSTSSPLEISTFATITTDATNDQFVSKSVDLQLNPLDQEVFVCTGVKIDFDRAIPVPLLNILIPSNLHQRLSVSSVRQTSYGGISSSNVLGAGQISYYLNGPANFFMHEQDGPMDTPPAEQDYLGIIATNDFFLNYSISQDFVAGQTCTAQVRLYGYRAKADAATYAALVQSEVLSA